MLSESLHESNHNETGAIHGVSLSLSHTHRIFLIFSTEKHRAAVPWRAGLQGERERERERVERGQETRTKASPQLGLRSVVSLQALWHWVALVLSPHNILLFPFFMGIS